MLNFDPYNRNAGLAENGKPHLLEDKVAFMQMKGSIEKVLEKYELPDRENKALKLVNLWENETFILVQQDVVTFRTTSNVVQRKVFFRGGFEYYLLFAIMN